jgi:hypothetical protein
LARDAPDDAQPATRDDNIVSTSASTTGVERLPVIVMSECPVTVATSDKPPAACFARF